MKKLDDFKKINLKVFDIISKMDKSDVITLTSEEGVEIMTSEVNLLINAVNGYCHDICDYSVTEIKIKDKIINKSSLILVVKKL